MLNELQKQHKIWANKNFGKQDSIDYVLGLAEEIGELSHAFLKRKQGIRNTENHNDNIIDAIGDIAIYLVGFCNNEGMVLEDVIRKVWSEVENRDWKRNPDCLDTDGVRKAIKESGFKYMLTCDEEEAFKRWWKNLHPLQEKDEPVVNIIVDEGKEYLKRNMMNPIFDELDFIEDKKPLFRPLKNSMGKLFIGSYEATKLLKDIIDKTRNLCTDCVNDYPECGAVKVEFGTGKGHDNIYQCSGFKEEKKAVHLCDTCNLNSSFCSIFIGKAIETSGILDGDKDITECPQYEVFVDTGCPV